MGLWFYFFIDESARWQLVNNKFDEAQENIRKILVKNKKFISDDDLKQKIKQLKQHIELVIIINFLILTFGQMLFFSIILFT